MPRLKSRFTMLVATTAIAFGGLAAPIALAGDYCPEPRRRRSATPVAATAVRAVTLETRPPAAVVTLARTKVATRAVRSGEVRAPRSPRFVTAIEGPASAGLSFPSAARERPVEFPPLPRSARYCAGVGEGRGEGARGDGGLVQSTPIGERPRCTRFHHDARAAERVLFARRGLGPPRFHRAGPQSVSRLGGAQRVRRCLAVQRVELRGCRCGEEPGPGGIPSARSAHRFLDGPALRHHLHDEEAAYPAGAGVSAPRGSPRSRRAVGVDDVGGERRARSSVSRLAAQ